MGTFRNCDCAIVANAGVYRLLEIGTQIDALRREQEQITKSLLPDTESELHFNDLRRRVYWAGGSVKLGKKSYLFVKTLWFGKNHQAELGDLEESVWTQRSEMEGFVARGTISTLVLHTRKNLMEAHFPYKIEVVKNFFSRELEGFRLVLAEVHGKTYSSEMDYMV